MTRELSNIEVDDKERIIKGTAIKFDTYSVNLGGFKEVILRSALDGLQYTNGVLYAVYNHDFNKPLGSTKAGNLKINIDDEGLHFELKMNNTSYANDLYENIKTGVVGGCSFSMLINESCIRTRGSEEGLKIVEVHKILELKEITITAIPAYLDTSVEARNVIGYDLEKEKLLLELELMEL